MKRFKTVFILLGVLAAICVVILVVSKVKEKKEEIAATDEVVLSVAPDSVTALSFSYDETSLSFHKGEETWSWDDDDAFPVDTDKINTMLSVFENLQAAFIIENPDDLDQYGLKDPTCTINLTTEDQTYTILLGAFSTMDQERYVSTGDGNVYLVATDPFETYEADLPDIILNDEVPDVTDTRDITFTGVADYTVTYQEDSKDSYCSEDLYFTDKTGKTTPLDTTKVQYFLSAVSDLSLTDYLSYNATEEELETCGLDDPEQSFTIDYTVTDENNETTQESFTLHLSRNPEELAEKVKAEDAGEEYSGTVTCYARVGESPIIYTISDSDYTSLSAVRYNDLRHTEVLTADTDKITGIDISLNDQTYTITSELQEAEETSDSDSDSDTESEPTRVFSFNGEEIDLSAFESALSAVTVSDFTSDEPEDAQEISLTFHLDDENFPEVTVTIYRVDGTNCLAVLDGETLGLVSRSSAVDLIEAVNAIVLG